MNRTASAASSTACVPPVRGRVGTPAPSPELLAPRDLDVAAGAGVAADVEGDGDDDPPWAEAEAWPPSGDDDADTDGRPRAAWSRLEEWSSWRVATLISAAVMVSRSANRMISTRTRLDTTSQLHHKNDQAPRSSRGAPRSVPNGRDGGI
jgi:hypothetical protein